jgi:hypothetical protein
MRKLPETLNAKLEACCTDGEVVSPGDTLEPRALDIETPDARSC